MTILIENPKDLSRLIEVVTGYLDKENEKFEIDMFLKIADLFDLADNTILEIAKIVREYYGRNSIEPNLREHLKEHGLEADEYFEVVKIPFDIHYKDKETKETSTVVEDRYLVVCKDRHEWRNFVLQERGVAVEDRAKYREQLNIDGGGDHLKISANLIETKMTSNAPENPKKIKRRHKESSVKATYLLAVVENVPETYANVKKIMEKLDIGQLKFQDVMSSDLKLINMIIGIQGHGATCPCPYCEWEKKSGIDGKATPRTFGQIR